MSCHVYTSIIANYLPKARVLAHSVKKHHPDFVFHLILSDEIPAGFDLSNEPFDELIQIGDLGIPDLKHWIFIHSIVELSTAVKGFGLQKLLGIPGCDHVLYLDPDIVVLSSLDKLTAKFSTASVLLTPHICEPEETLEAILDNEFSVLQHGIYNLGFVGVNNTAEGRRFADWWSDRLHSFCYDDIPRGLFTDQRWVDLAPAYFPALHILRDPVYNVCTWNLTHRTITGSLKDGLFANGEPIAFYHFSGFDSGAQEQMLRKYGSVMPALFELRDWYIAESARMGQETYSRIPWAYGTFDNGIRIERLHRLRYRDRGDLRSAFPDPWSASDPARSYYHWFGANDESVVQAAPAAEVRVRSRQAAPAAFRDYVVVLVVAAGAEPVSADFVSALKENTHCGPQSLYVAGPRENISVPTLAGLTTVETDSDRTDDVIADVLTRFRGRDVILVRPGLQLPPRWDVRLAWSSHRHAMTGLMSPVMPSILEAAGCGTIEAQPASLDAFFCERAEAVAVDAGMFSPGCVLVKSEIPAIVLNKGFAPTPPRLAEAAGQARFMTTVAPHIFVGENTAGQVLRVAGPRNSDLPGTDLLSGIVGTLHNGAQVGVNASPVLRMRSRTLHMMHNWGGGLEQWVREFCRSDAAHDNLILRPRGTWGAFGSMLTLHSSPDSTEPIETWTLDPVIPATAARHENYRAILRQICYRYGIDRILVSSLIGHSLDALRLDVPTAVVCHDYYPFCPALNITFGEVCTSCDTSRLNECTSSNSNHRFFLNVPPPVWENLRTEFADVVNERSIPLIAPSASVPRHYSDLLPALTTAFHVIPHGTRRVSPESLDLSFDAAEPLRIVVLGRLAVHKGLGLLQAMMPALREIAEVYLVGCGETGNEFAGQSGVHVIPEYEWELLPDVLQEIRPNLGLLLSTVPETFSYTLQELFDLGIPVIATRLGSFADRIEHGVSGYLCTGDPDALLAAIGQVYSDRSLLSEMHLRIKATPHRTLADMHAEYDRLIPVPALSPNGYFAERVTFREQNRHLQIFWRTEDSSFAESASALAYPYGARRQIAKLWIPQLGSDLAQIRLDPAACTGFFVLYNLKLRDKTGKTVWKWDGNASLFEQAPAVYNIVALDREPGTDGLPLYLMGNDPQFLVPLPPESLANFQHGCLEVDFSLETAQGSLEKFILNSQLSQSPADTSVTEQEIIQLRQQLRSQEEQEQSLVKALSVRASLEERTASQQSEIKVLAEALLESRVRITELEGSLPSSLGGRARFLLQGILPAKKSSKQGA